MATKIRQDPVSIRAKLRQAYPWFDEAAAKARNDAIVESRKKRRTQGPQLTEQELCAATDELEELQRLLNPLLNRREELVAALAAHWGHTGIEEIEGKLGKTLIVSSFEYAIVDSDAVQQNVSEGVWRSISKRVMQAGLALAAGAKDPDLQKLICRYMGAKVKLTITAPSSRRPRSGGPEESEDE